MYHIISIAHHDITNNRKQSTLEPIEFKTQLLKAHMIILKEARISKSCNYRHSLVKFTRQVFVTLSIYLDTSTLHNALHFTTHIIT